jgi:parallel beta-helix repeat protein
LGKGVRLSRSAVSAIMISLLVVGTLALAFNFQPVKASGTIYINADGSISPSTAPISTIDNVTYTFTGNITNDSIVIERDNIVLNGAGSTLQGPGSYNGVTLFSTSNATLENITITGFEYGIWLNSSSRNCISGNIITNSGMYGIWLGSSSNDNTVCGNNIMNNGYGVLVTISSNNNTVSENNITANAGYGVCVSYSSYNNTVCENLITENSLDGIWFASGGNIISKNNITANNESGVYLFTGSNMVSDNNIATNGQDGVFVDDNSNTICGNNVTANNGSGVYVNQLAGGNNITANNITTNNGHGIYLNGGLNTIYGNNIATNGQDGVFVVGWIFLESLNNMIYGNNITANGDHGVNLQFCSSNTVYGNNITANTTYGAYLYHSGNNMIYGNNITNDNIGVCLFYPDSNNNTICGNDIMNNEYGVVLISSNNNEVYHNSFMNNTQQTSSVNSANKWDDGYPNGGNCWSDYVGIDEMNGPSQNLPGGDDIGDTPYTIDSNNRDEYPLMSPHYVVATNITYSKTVIGQGLCMNISATVANCGAFDESLNLTIVANSTLVTENVTSLAIAHDFVVVFTWNVSDCVLYSNYTLSACVSPVPGGASFLEHNCTGGLFVVSIKGDLTGGTANAWDFVPDGKVYIEDVSVVAKCFGQKVPPAPANCDVTGQTIGVPDGKIQIDDVATVAKHFGDHYP